MGQPFTCLRGDVRRKWWKYQIGESGYCSCSLTRSSDPHIEVDMTTTLQTVLSTCLDFLNNPVEIGDEVVFPSPTGELRHGTVTNISPGAIKLLTVQSLIDQTRTTIVLQKNTSRCQLPKTSPLRRSPRP